MTDPLVIMPTYRAFDYARAACESLLRACPDATVLVIDDASPDWEQDRFSDLYPSVQTVRFYENRGLTMALNYGLRLARDHQDYYEYVVCANSDLLFARNWWTPARAAIDRGNLIGPVTNAPGDVSDQHVGRYAEDYQQDDDQRAVDRTGQYLADQYGSKIIPGKINGFCMAGHVDDWWEHRYDLEHVFNPDLRKMPSGRKNPQPRMLGQEHDFAARARQGGLQFGFVPGSFVFHFRSASRGRKHAKGQGMAK